MLTPPDSDTWIALTEAAMPVGESHDWAALPGCGAIVVFSGTVRDHADGREGVQTLTYEAYVEHAEPKMAAIADEIRQRWPMTGRIALLHRVGELRVGESSVVVTVSTPHRPEAFEAARFGIDALKASVPIWKKEVWNGGSDWALGAQHLVDASEVGQP